MAAPTPNDETIAETVGSDDVANNEGDTQSLHILRLIAIPLLLLG